MYCVALSVSLWDSKMKVIGEFREMHLPSHRRQCCSLVSNATMSHGEWKYGQRMMPRLYDSCVACSLDEFEQ